MLKENPGDSLSSWWRETLFPFFFQLLVKGRPLTTVFPSMSAVVILNRATFVFSAKPSSVHGVLYLVAIPGYVSPIAVIAVVGMPRPTALVGYLTWTPLEFLHWVPLQNQSPYQL